MVIRASAYSRLTGNGCKLQGPPDLASLRCCLPLEAVGNLPVATQGEVATKNLVHASLRAAIANPRQCCRAHRSGATEWEETPLRHKVMIDNNRSARRNGKAGIHARLHVRTLTYMYTNKPQTYKCASTRTPISVDHALHISSSFVSVFRGISSHTFEQAQTEHARPDHMPST